MAVFVIGMHRSGTSMVAGVLEALGVNFGPQEELLPANQSNLNGYYENRRVLEINDELTAANGLHWRTLPAISQRRKVEGVEAYIKAVGDVGRSFENSKLWGVKDPRLSFFLPYWKKAAPSPSAIICVRRPESVARSLHVRNEISPVYGAALWELYTLAALKNSRRMPRIALVYEQLLIDPTAAVKRIISTIPELSGVEFSDSALTLAAERIQADLDHSDDGELDAAFVTESQARLYDRLAAGALALSKKDETATVSSELTRLEASHQAAKATIARTNSELSTTRAALDSERTSRAAFLNRVKDLAETFSVGKLIEPTPDAVVEALRASLRKLGEPPLGFVSTASVEEISSLKEDRIHWLKNELEAASIRARNSLEQLNSARVEIVELKAKFLEAERMRRSSEEVLARLQEESAAMLNDVAMTREQARVASIELHAVSVSRDALEVELSTLREQHERVRRERALLLVELDQTRGQEASARSDVRKLKHAEADLRAEMLKAQEKAADLGRQLVEKERAEFKTSTAMNELVVQAARLDRTVKSLTADAAELSRRETDARNALAEGERRFATARDEVTSLVQRNEAVSSALTSLKQAHTAALEERDRLVVERDALAAERQQLVEAVQANRSTVDEERARLAAQSQSLASEMSALRQRNAELESRLAQGEKIADQATATGGIAKVPATATPTDPLEEPQLVRAELERLCANEHPTSRSAERELKTFKVAMTNAVELIKSLEAEVEELKTRVPAEPHGAVGVASAPTVKPKETADLEVLVEKLRAERSALEKALAESRKSQAIAEAMVGASTVTPKTVADPASAAMRERLTRQFSAMQELVSAIDTLLAPKVGGRFWIPVRKIRVKLVQLRQIVDLEASRVKRA